MRIDLGQGCDSGTKDMMAPWVKVDSRGSWQPRKTREGLGLVGGVSSAITCTLRDGRHVHLEK